MKAKCKHSIRVKLEGCTRSFTAGMIYDVADLDKATIRAHFEAPEIAPPKKQTRKESEGD